MTVDEFLRSRHSPAFLAILEPSTEPTLVRMAAVVPAHARLHACDRFLVIAKTAIEDVEPTEQTVACCGKLHVIARVRLAPGAAISAEQIIAAYLDEPRLRREQRIARYEARLRAELGRG
jgi:hypothetical protein